MSQANWLKLLFCKNSLGGRCASFWSYLDSCM